LKTGHLEESAAGGRRAALILQDMLGFSDRYAADVLGTTVASVNAALRRARKAVAGSAARTHSRPAAVIPYQVKERAP
jgi:DNA-directed RNA polymerase specialized sigma24 family protein